MSTLTIIMICHLCWRKIITEPTERSPIIIQNCSNPSSQKNLDLWPYDRTTVRPYKVLLLACMVKCMPTPQLCSVVQWSVHWALSWMTWVLVLAGAWHCALETCRKKNASSTFSLAKSIYHSLHHQLQSSGSWPLKKWLFFVFMIPLQYFVPEYFYLLSYSDQLWTYANNFFSLPFDKFFWYHINKLRVVKGN